MGYSDLNSGLRNEKRMNIPPIDGSGDVSEQNDANGDELVTPGMQLLMLQNQHRALDDKITELYAFPYRNQILLQRLKKQKLRLKDAIERIKDEMIPDLNA